MRPAALRLAVGLALRPGLRLGVALAVGLLSSVPAQAVKPDEMLADPALEARAREVSKALRCVVCQNQSIDDSPDPLARDMRIVVRERIAAGASEAEVLDFMVARYGDFVLMRPPFQPNTWLLWAGPAVLLVLAATGAASVILRRRAPITDPEAAPLTPEEQARLAALIADPPETP